MNAHWIIAEGAEGAPQMGVARSRKIMRNSRHHAVPTTRLDQADDGDQQCAKPDQTNCNTSLKMADSRPPRNT